MIRLLVAAPDPAMREAVRALLAQERRFEVVGMARDGHEAVQLARTLAPDIALLCRDLRVYDGWAAAEMLSVSGIDSVLLSTEGVDYRRAMRAGARDEIAWPTTSEALVSALCEAAAAQQRRKSEAFLESADPQRLCRIFAITGAKGGVGKTTLAVNLAIALAHLSRAETALVDLYAQFGDASLMLNAAPRLSLHDLSRAPEKKITPEILREHMTLHACGLSLLVGSLTPTALDAISPAVLDQVFGILKRTHRFVVLDVPPILHPATLHALSHATETLLVANLFDLTTARDTRLLIEAIEGVYVPKEKLSVVLNRVSRSNRLGAQEVQQALDCRIRAQIPNDGRIVPQSVNTGIPFALSHPRSPAAVSVFGLGRSLMEDS